MRKITAKEFADILNISKPTFLSKVRRGEIIPINKEDWQIDGEYIFSYEEVERVKNTYRKPGKTVKEVAEQLNVSQARVHQLIKRDENPLPAFQRFYNGKVRYFVAESDLKEFLDKHHFKPKNKKQMMSKKHGCSLFQLFKKNDQYARIMKIDDDGEGLAITENDKHLSLQQLFLEGYEPVYNIEKKRYITTKGYVKFSFPKPNQIKATAFNVIDIFYRAAGIENMRLFVNENNVNVEVKPILLPKEYINDEMINFLQSFICEGKVSVRIDGRIRLESDLEPINAFVPSSFKKEIRQKARKLGMTLDEYVYNVLKKELNLEEK